MYSFFFFNDTATTEIYTLSLHDALPIYPVFHGGLVRTDFVLAALPQRAPAAVHALGDLVVLDRGFPVGGLLGFDELALEQDDVLGIVELDDVGGVRR